MYKAYWSYSISEEKQQEYLDFVSNELTPFFKSHGAKSYEVYQGLDNGKSLMYVAEMVFDNLETMRETMGKHGKDLEYDAMVDRFHGFTDDGGVKPGGRFEKK